MASFPLSELDRAAESLRALTETHERELLDVSAQLKKLRSHLATTCTATVPLPDATTAKHDTAEAKTALDGPQIIPKDRDGYVQALKNRSERTFPRHDVHPRFDTRTSNVEDTSSRPSTVS